MSEIEESNSSAGSSETLREETSPSNDTKYLGKKLRILQGLLEEHKAQSLIVKSLKEELDHLEQNPLLYLQNRKSFLYHAYTQTLDECLLRMKFDVKFDAGYAISDREVGVVFGHIYQINPHEVLSETFKFERAEAVNKVATDRVAEWQSLDSLPEGHSTTVMEVGKRVLQGLIGAIDVPATLEITDTEHLVQQAKQLQNEEERLKSDFPAATKVLDPDDESGSTDNKRIVGNGHGSEGSGLLVEKEECATPRDEEAALAPTMKTLENGEKNSCTSRSETSKCIDAAT